MTEGTTGDLMYSHAIDRRRFGATITGSTDDAAWKRLMLDWYGLTPLRGEQWREWALCPHRALSPSRHVETNECRQWSLRFGYQCWDHARAWRNRDGDVVITVEPYGNPIQDADAFRTLTTELDQLGLQVLFEGRSPYGASYILFVLRK